MLNIGSTQPVDSRCRLRCLQILATTILTLALLAPAVALATDTATQVVENLHAKLMGVMQNAENLGYEGRYQRLAPVVISSYDFPFISKIVVGRYWRNFSTVQKEQFVDAFTKLSIATYANRFDGYSGESFKTISGEELKRGRHLIKTLLIKANGEEVELDYILHQNGKQWQIINVIAQGVSDLSLKRADYTSYIKKKGFDALLQKLDEKIKSYEG